MQEFLSYFGGHFAEIASLCVTLILSIISWCITFVKSSERRISGIIAKCNRQHVDEVDLSSVYISTNGTDWYRADTVLFRKEEK